MTGKEYRTATKLVRGGLNRSAHQETSEALYLTSGFVYGSAEEAAAAFRARDAALDVLQARPPPKTSSLLRRAAPRALRPRRRLEDATAATAAPTAMAGTAREETSFGASFMYRNDY